MAEKKATTPKKTVSKKEVSEDLIRNKAQEIYEIRIEKGVHGSAESDWLQAEKELGVKK